MAEDEFRCLYFRLSGCGRGLNRPSDYFEPSLFPQSDVHFMIIFVPSALGQNLFGDGNLPAAFNDFRTSHVCNELCKFFELTLDIPQSSFPEEPHSTDD